MFKAIFLIVLCCGAVYFNLYKAHLLEDLIELQSCEYYNLGQACNTNANYTIFPWMKNGQVSSSSPVWLLAHMHVALLHIVLTALWILNFPQNDLHAISHWLFTGMIIMNIHHFGEAPWYIAILANGLPLSVMSLIYEYKPTYKFMYLLALISPVLFEVALYYTN